MDDRHIPNDEYIDSRWCGKKRPHEDHYWTRKRDGVEFYCDGGTNTPDDALGGARVSNEEGKR